MFQIATNKNVHIVKIPTLKRLLDVSRGSGSMAMKPDRNTLKRITNGDPRILLLQWSLGSLFLAQFSSDNFFFLVYTFLSLVLTIDFCCSQLILFFILFKKDKKIVSRNKMNYSQKSEIVKERWGGPSYKLCRALWGPTFKHWRGSWDPIFKL